MKRKFGLGAPAPAARAGRSARVRACGRSIGNETRTRVCSGGRRRLGEDRAAAALHPFSCLAPPWIFRMTASDAVIRAALAGRAGGSEQPSRGAAGQRGWAGSPTASENGGRRVAAGRSGKSAAHRHGCRRRHEVATRGRPSPRCARGLHRREEVFRRYLTSLLRVRSPHYTNVY
jgi:hypothetical protein